MNRFDRDKVYIKDEFLYRNLTEFANLISF